MNDIGSWRGEKGKKSGQGDVKVSSLTQANDSSTDVQAELWK